MVPRRRDMSLRMNSAKSTPTDAELRAPRRNANATRGRRGSPFLRIRAYPRAEPNPGHRPTATMPSAVTPKRPARPKARAEPSNRATDEIK